MSAFRYIKPSTVRKLAREYKDKQVAKGYLLSLDAWVEEKVRSSCRVAGSHKRLTDDLLGFSK